MQTTPNMGLTEWDQSGDPYSHSQLAANFGQIDVHDHVPLSSGGHGGVQISTGGIQAGAITNALLAANAVTTDKILDHTILSQDLDSSVLNGLIPLGTVIPWWRPSPTITVPGAWVIAMGQTLTGTQHDYGSPSSITVPDLRNCFVLGADTSNTGTTPSTAPAIGYKGGSNTASFSHTHSLGAHTHTIPDHSHVVNAHGHNVSAHTHGIPAGGAHVHGIFQNNGVPSSIFTRAVNLTFTSPNAQALYVPGLNDSGFFDSGPGWGEAPMTGPLPGDDPEVQNTPWDVDGQGNHAHGGATNAAGTTTDAQAPGTNVATLATNAAGTGTSGTEAPSLNGVDIRPQFCGLLFLIKVKNS